MRRRSGFTLVELMVVLALIAVISALAIPSLLNARKAGNEASAISSLRTLCTVNMQYRTRFRMFAPALADLQASGFIDTVLASGTKSGYLITYARPNPESWSCNADPASPGFTGDRHFFTDESGVIRVDVAAAAGPASTPIDG